MTSEPVDRLAGALGSGADLLTQVGPQDWARATPCPGWTVAEVVHHVAQGNRIFTASLTGGPQPDPDGDTPYADPERDYRESAAVLVDAFGQPGALDQTVTLPIGPLPATAALNLRIVEVLVHGWDVATAMEVSPPFDHQLAEQALTFTREMLAALPPSALPHRPFGPPQPVPDHAPALDRLVGLLGRRPT